MGVTPIHAKFITPLQENLEIPLTKQCPEGGVLNALVGTGLNFGKGVPCCRF